MAKIGIFNNAPGAAYIDNSITLNASSTPKSDCCTKPEPEEQEMPAEDFYLDNPSGQLFHPNKQYHPIDYIRIFNAMYELGYFVDENGSKPNKWTFFKQIGIVCGMDFSHYSTNLSTSITKSNDYSVKVTEKLFDELKKKAIDYINRIKSGYKERNNMR